MFDDPLDTLLTLMLLTFLCVITLVGGFYLGRRSRPAPRASGWLLTGLLLLLLFHISAQFLALEYTIQAYTLTALIVGGLALFQYLRKERPAPVIVRGEAVPGSVVTDCMDCTEGTSRVSTSPTDAAPRRSSTASPSRARARRRRAMSSARPASSPKASTGSKRTP